jgi:glycerol kinase
VARAIVWQDRRTTARCEQLRRAGQAGLIQRKTGLVLDAYFSATKLEWLLDEVPGARAREAGELAFGTVDSWLIFKLTGGRVHATDPSNAARTLLMDIHTLDWDDELLRLFHIPRRCCRASCPPAACWAKARPGCWARRRSRSPAWPATSRPPPSARPALRPAWPRTPTAPAASC